MARMVGINHVALEVQDLEAALAWYAGVFEFEVSARHGDWMAFIDMGDQFLAFTNQRTQPPDQARHFGLVVDDKEAVRSALRRQNLTVQPSGSLDFTDPWGNHIQVVDYHDIQFTKAPEVLKAMGLGDLGKTESARRELREKGIAA